MVHYYGIPLAASFRHTGVDRYTETLANIRNCQTKKVTD